MASVRFSVNIPVYNGEKVLARCVDSVLCQSFGDFEIVIVDDGSTDGTVKLCRRLSEQDKRIRFFSGENKGPLLTRVFLANEARGEYSLFVDCDDTLRPDALEVIDKKIRQYDCDLLIFNYSRINEHGTTEKGSDISDDVVYKTETELKEIRDRLLFTSKINPMWMKAVKTELFSGDETDYSSYARIKMGEDFLQSLHIMFRARKIVRVPDALYNYYCNVGSLSTTVDSEKLKSMLTVREAAVKYTLPSDYRRLALQAMLFALNCVKRISLSELDLEAKKDNFETIKNNEFYNSFVLKNIRPEDLNPKRRLMYRLFSKGMYRSLVRLVKTFSDKFAIS